MMEASEQPSADDDEEEEEEEEPLFEAAEFMGDVGVDGELRDVGMGEMEVRWNMHVVSYMCWGQYENFGEILLVFVHLYQNTFL